MTVIRGGTYAHRSSRSGVPAPHRSFGVARSFTPLGAYGSGLQDRRLLKRAFGRPQTWSHCRVWPCMKIKSGAAGPAPAPGRHARRTDVQIETAHAADRPGIAGCRLPRPPLSSSPPPRLGRPAGVARDRASPSPDAVFRSAGFWHLAEGRTGLARGSGRQTWPGCRKARMRRSAVRRATSYSSAS